MKKILALLVIVMAIVTSVSQAGSDRLLLGNQESEKIHNAVLDDTIAGMGGLGQSCRYIVSGGKLICDMSVDPDVVNLITLKVWGDDYLGREVKAVDGTTISIEAPKFAMYALDADGKEVKLETATRYAMDDKPDLPGRFYYETFVAAKELTEGRDTLTVIVALAKEIGGKYVNVGGPPPTIIPDGVYGRGLYAVYSHTDNFFAPPKDEPRGTQPAAKSTESKTELTKVKAYLLEQLENGCAETMQRQLYGPKWEKARKEIGMPHYLYGLFDYQGFDYYLEQGKGKSGDDEYWRERVTGSANGRSHAGAAAMFMKMYYLPESKYYQDDDLLKRALAALDAYCVYQGAEGTLEIGGGKWGWIGGPNRRKAGGGLPGYFAGSLAESFMALWPAFQDNPELLDEMIDNNGDGKKTVTRKDAYAQLFGSYIEYRLHQRGGVTNQDTANFLGAVKANECLRILAPELMASEKVMAEFAESAAGLRPVIKSPNAAEQWWFSPKGTSIEGGFTPGYGQQQEALGEMAEITDNKHIKAQLNKFCDSFQHFVYPAGDDLRVEGPIGSRHKPFIGRDLDWAGFLYAALELNNPIAQRFIRYGLDNAAALYNVKLDASARMHLTARWFSAYRVYINFDAAMAIPASDYVLPTEQKGPYAWSDEMSRNVMIKDHESLIYFSFDQNYQGLSRYHHLGDGFHSFGDLTIVDDDGLYIAKFGHYLIAMNGSDTIYLEQPGSKRIFDAPENVTAAMDLISGKTIDLRYPVILKPNSSLILDTTRAGRILGPQPPALVESMKPVDADWGEAAYRWKLQGASKASEMAEVVLPLPNEPRIIGALQSVGRGANWICAWQDNDGDGRHDDNERQLLVTALSEYSKMIALGGVSYHDGSANIVIGFKTASFSDYSSWQWQGTDVIKPDNSASLVFEIAARHHHSSGCVLGEFSFVIDEPVSFIEFDYDFNQVAARFPIELKDAAGKVLWKNDIQNTVVEHVTVEGPISAGTLTFAVGNAGTIVYPGWSHHISNVRFGKAGEKVFLGLTDGDGSRPYKKGELLFSDDFSGDISAWQVEQMPGGNVEIRNGKLEINDARGCTVWYKEPLSGPVMMEYVVEIVKKDGVFDRGSDLNCFWMAIDPEMPDDLLAGGEKRFGSFGNYHNLRLYYVGYGANHNSTTRFRRYRGDGTRPMLEKYDLRDQKFMLKYNTPIKIQVVACGEVIQYLRDGELVFDLRDPQAYTDGWFGFRTVHNHMTVDDFNVYRLVPTAN